MTQKELIDCCNTYRGECRDCECRVACNRYRNKYHSAPILDDVHARERYNDEEI